jgi:phosphogluconate dehydratase
VLVDEDEFAARVPSPRVSVEGIGTGRELFAPMRAAVGRADEGAHIFGSLGHVWDKSDSAPFVSHEGNR